METYEFKVTEDFHFKDNKFWEGQSIGLTNVASTIYWDITRKGKKLLTLSRSEVTKELFKLKGLRYRQRAGSTFTMEDLRLALQYHSDYLLPNQKFKDCFTVYQTHDEFLHAMEILTEFHGSKKAIPMCDMPLVFTRFNVSGREPNAIDAWLPKEGTPYGMGFSHAMCQKLKHVTDIHGQHYNFVACLLSSGDSFAVVLENTSIIGRLTLFTNYINDDYIWRDDG